MKFFVNGLEQIPTNDGWRNGDRVIDEMQELISDPSYTYDLELLRRSKRLDGADTQYDAESYVDSLMIFDYAKTDFSDTIESPFIPIPAAVWLFGSGFGLLVVVAKRKGKRNVKEAPMTRKPHYHSMTITTAANKINVCLSFVLTIVAVTAAFLPNSAPAQQPPQGMVSYWKFDEGSGTVANDDVGGNHGIVNGPIWGAGQVNGALIFAGTNGAVEVGDAPTLDIESAITIMAWVKVDGSTGDHQVVLSKWYRDGVTRSSYILELQPNGRILQLAIPGVTGSGSSSGASTVPIVFNEWTHVAGTYDGSVAKVYLNGMTTGSYATQGTIPVSDGNVFIGAHDSLPDRNLFNGVIDEVVLYDRALTDEEIHAYYRSSSLPGAMCDANTNHCYKRFDDTMSWHMANVHCESVGGYLATITSQDEQDFVFSNVVSGSPNDCWIGATDEAAEGDWRWSVGEEWNYTNWNSGEPDNCAGLEHYGAMSASDGTWTDQVSLNNGSGGCDCPIVFESMSTVCEWGEIDYRDGDLNGDGCIDRSDADILLQYVRSSGPDNEDYDLNDDGSVNIADVRTLVLLFDNPLGAPCN